MPEHPPACAWVMFLSPIRGRTPWWARHLTYSHVVTVIDGQVWSQPIFGVGRCVPLEQYIEECGDRKRQWVRIPTDRFDMWDFRFARHMMTNRKGQRLRTMLRYLKLWPWRPWNCTSPVRSLLWSFGITIEGETPDEIFKELNPSH